MNILSNVIKYGLSTIGVVLCLMVIGGPNVNAGSEKVEAFREGFELSAATGFTGFVLFLCIAAIILFFVLLLITNFKKAIRSMIGVIAFAVLYMILRAIGTSDTSSTLNLKNPVAESTIDGTHAGLMTCMIGIAVAIIAIFAGPFFGRLRK